MTHAAGRALIGLVAVLALLVLCAGCSMKDDTDPPNGISGMGLHTDYATGCQYLSRDRSLTPRIAADGHSHMGCKGGAQ
jgi:hypothetical protein